MRFTAPALIALLLTVVAGCSTEQETTSPPQPAPTGPADEEPESPAPTPTPGPTDPAETPACAAVRAGITAFNEGDYEGTVSRFATAVPLAQDQLDGSARADDLLEAVRWYAELPPADYPEASRSSSEFEQYKQITLEQCQPVAGPNEAPPLEA